MLTTTMGGNEITHKIFRIFNAAAFINIIFHDFFNVFS